MLGLFSRSGLCFLQDFAKADARCPNYVREAFVLIDELVQMGEAGNML